MFSKIDIKLKKLAVLETILGILGSIIAGIVVMAELEVWIGFVVWIGGFITSWVSSMFIYAFGEIITKLNEIAGSSLDQKRLTIAHSIKSNKEDNDKANEIIKQIKEEDEKLSHEELDPDEIINTPESDECPICFAKIKSNARECPNCGHKIGK